VIIITSTINYNCTLFPGDTFNLTIRDGSGEETLITEIILEECSINYAISFRFAEEDGSLVSFNLCGFFGNRENLPEEIKNAICVDDLSELQRYNFHKTLKTTYNK